MKRPKKSEGDGMKSDAHKNEKKNIEDMLKNVMKEHLSYQSQAKIENTKNMQNLQGIISEYLSPFILIGYDITGKPVNLIHAKSQMDADALSASLNRFLFNHVNKNEEEK